MNKIVKIVKEYIKNNDILFVFFIHIKSYSIYFLNKISNYQLAKNKFRKILGYPPKLKKPSTFNEKILWKKIYDRNPLLPVTADKYQVRSYFQEILGKEIAKQITIPLLYVTEKPDTIPFNTLAIPYIIKPNHASRLYFIVKDNRYDQDVIIKTCKRWLKIPFGLWNMEWAYQPIARKIVIEQLLLDEDGNIPRDYKFHIFHGRCKSITVISDRMKKPSTINIFDREWNEIESNKRDDVNGKKIEKPINYELMLEYAQNLGNNFDYVRVDLYNLKGHIYFGELTHYPASGFRRSVNEKFSKYWIVKPKYWEK